ncbi:DUF2986 domain-containing protein [Amphritea sp. HPY]|uniref:DUF2986 domain-containing protein n=1 Tax=Amphritea sp. HPY TaxID=3421652 RepID=UPI003D7D2057
MNRKKKLNSILKKRAKKANAKNKITNKPRYVAKADRDEQDAAGQESVDEVS